MKTRLVESVNIQTMMMNQINLVTFCHSTNFNNNYYATTYEQYYMRYVNN